jgi:hypothetical protein
MRGRRLVGERRRAWFIDLTGAEPPARVRRVIARPSRTPAATAAVAATEEVLVIATEGAMRYHRSGCRLIVDRPVTSVPRTLAAATGLEPCGVCGA